MRSLQIVRFQGRESNEFATVRVRVSGGYPEPVQVISKCGANSRVETSLEFGCSHKIGGHSLDEEVSCRRKSYENRIVKLR